MKRLCIIGGGAAGMAAAICGAMEAVRVQSEEPVQIYILEGNDRLGKKLLVTGNGKCNFTNAVMSAACFRSDSGAAVGAEWLEQFLENSRTERVLSLFERLGILYEERNGYYYPVSGQAGTVVEAFAAELDRLGIKVYVNQKVRSIIPRASGFDIMVQLNENRTKHYEADAVILAAGSCAYPKTGSDGTGYMLARRLGLKVNSWHPALTAIHGNICSLNKSDCKNSDYCKLWAGVRTTGRITITDAEGLIIAKEQGELQLTDYGVSGIPAFQVSRYVSVQFPVKGRKQEAAERAHSGNTGDYGSAGSKQRLYAVLDFLPAVEEEQLWQSMIARKRTRGGQRASEALLGIHNSKVLQTLLAVAGIPADMLYHQVSEEQLRQFCSLCKCCRLEITGVKGYEAAQICAGGVSLDEISPVTMEAGEIAGLYVAGELLDVDGMCGGYNLHSAFVSGMRSGEAAVKRLIGRM